MNIDKESIFVEGAHFVDQIKQPKVERGSCLWAFANFGCIISGAEIIIGKNLFNLN